MLFEHGRRVRNGLRAQSRESMETPKQWLNSLPWEAVQAMNEALCKQQSTAFQATQTLQTARQVWSDAVGRTLSLHDVLDICRKCREIAPFTFNNGNTFAGLARKLVDDWVKTLPAVEGQIITNTIGHYVAGMISRKELAKVLQHFWSSWTAFLTAQQMAARAVPTVAINTTAQAPTATATTNQTGVRAGLDGAILTAPQ